MDYDEILDELGHFSKWHLLYTLLLWPCSAFAAIATMCYSFSALEPSDYRCLIPKCNETTEHHFDVLQFGTEIFATDGDGNPDYCKRFPVKSNFTGQCNSKDDFDLNASEDQMVLCTPDQNVIYGDFGMDYTVTTRYNLICDDQFKVALASSIFMSSNLFSSYIFGYLSDKIGRKKSTLIALLMVAGGVTLSSFMPEYISFTIIRFITGFGSLGLFLVAITLNLELVGNKYATMTGIFFEIPWALGEIVLGVLAMGIRDYRWYQTVLAAPMIVMLGVFYFIPESPRWLIRKKKYKEAREVINQAAKFNKITLSPHLLDDPIEDQRITTVHGDEKSTIEPPLIQELGTFDLFKHPGCRTITLIMFVNWMAVTLGYYGISMSSTSLSDNVYLAFIYSALTELPAYTLSVWFIDHWGRKPTLVFSLFLGGVCCIPAGYAPGNFKLALSLLGKFGCSVAFAIVYIYTMEMYPTVIRTTGLGLCSMVARIGGIAAPQVAIYLPSVTFEELPMIIFGSTTFIAALLSLKLPETLGAPLVESLDEIYILHKYSKPFFHWWSPEQIKDNIDKIHAVSNVRKVSTTNK